VFVVVVVVDVVVVVRLFVIFVVNFRGEFVFLFFEKLLLKKFILDKRKTLQK